MVEFAALSAQQLAEGYRKREFSPVEVTEHYLARIEEHNPQLNAYLTVTPDLAREQAKVAEAAFAAGEETGPLTGVPIGVKDAFYLAGYPTSLGSAVYKDQIAKIDSGVARRLREAGSVILGKTNTAEFGQSATAENMLAGENINPWGEHRTPGGSSGGSASAVAARLAAIAVGSDGGGSVRIPAAFCGIFGLKTTPGLCPDEKGFRGMTDFVSAGPMASTVADARAMLGVLAEQDYSRRETTKLRIAYMPSPEGWPVQQGVSAVIAGVAEQLAGLGHEVVESELDISGWKDIFGPLVLEDEHRERGHLLQSHAAQLTRYERSSLRAAAKLDPAAVHRAQTELPKYRARIAAYFNNFDVILTPTTATVAFDIDEFPTEIAGRPADRLWGPYPFTAPFNVAGVAGATVPSGLAEGLPVGAQLLAAAGQEQLLLDLSEQLEEVVGFDVLAAAPGLAQVRV